MFVVTVFPRTTTTPGPVEVPVAALYLLGGELSDADLSRLVATLLHDPVVAIAEWRRVDAGAEEPPPVHPPLVLEVAFRPGVTDNEAESLLLGAQSIGITGLHTVRSLRRFLPAAHDDLAAAERLFRAVANPLIQEHCIYAAGAALPTAWYAHLIATPPAAPARIAHVPLRQAGDEALMRISRQGILALDLAEMQTIRAYFAAEGRDPTDGELETIAQTWSEHCSHKTFKARVRYRNLAPEPLAPDLAANARYSMLHMVQRDCEIDSLIRTFLMQATREVTARREARAAEGGLPVLSAFVDNAGIVAFGDAWEVSIKVETHNHPSALEPFGGANTGVGGVIRDVLGVSGRPIANTDVLCFGPLDLPEASLPSGSLHPRRVYTGVVAGVRDYGNKLGIPTVNGAILFDEGYTANPLVYCGTVGIAPRGRHPRAVAPGDAVVVVGGRTGRDGIHGATFSSEELTHETAELVGSAVQIGDPITEKKMLDLLLAARDAGLYSAITDCGAGGLSSAVGEMGEHTGVAVELEQVQLKYPGLLPWEIWLSEAQERMVLAVPQEHLAAFLALCAAEDVAATPIGRFTDDQRLLVTYRGAPLVDLAMQFLHGGRPQRVMDAAWRRPEPQGDAPARPRASHPAGRLASDLLTLLSHPNIASKEAVVRSYDHEVGGATVIKPLVGAQMDGPGDAAVLWPRPEIPAGLALGCGINPRYGRSDPYWMALACVDEALRNVVAVGGDPRQAVLLDNFCWGDPRQPDRLAGLVRAAAGCYDAALGFEAPFISGKDSLNNEYRLPSGERRPIPGTLLITALAHVPDVRHTVTMDLKQPGNRVYLVGATRYELEGSHYQEIAGEAAHGRAPSSIPYVDLGAAAATFRALHAAIRQGLVRACHDLSEGGLGVAAAEMCLAGWLGLRLDLRVVEYDWSDRRMDDVALLFSESTSRFLVEVTPEDAQAFEQTIAGRPYAWAGFVTASPQLRVIGVSGAELFVLPVDDLRAAWQATLA